MRKRVVFFYWLIILIPTFLISIYFFRMMSHERERLHNEALLTLKNRAVQIADTIKITMDTVEDELGSALSSLDEKRMEEVLKNLEKSNPLVRNVFIYETDKGLTYPPKGIAATKEEKLFAKRYDAFFTGRVKFESTIDKIVDEIVEEKKIVADKSPAKDIGFLKKENYSFSPRSKVKAEKEKGRKKLVSFARQTKQPVQTKKDSTKIKKTEWLTWFSGNRLYILGWVKTGDNLIYGIELEIVTILSQITLEFPENVSKGVTYALTDGAGTILHRSGSYKITKKTKAEFAVDLLPHLPHWQVALYLDSEMKSKNRFDNFIILSGILLGIFIVSIITGGILLTLLAYRNMKDAFQKTSFVSNVSHELKTPLTSIRMYAELLGEDRIKDENKKKRYLEVIIEESRRLTRLVNNVLNFSRLERGLKKYNISGVDLKSEIIEVAESLNFSLKGTPVELKLNLPEYSVITMTDRDAVRQVALNLIDNAVKYAAEGKIIEIYLNSNQSRCFFEISDRGSGVPKGHREKIFEKFHRVDNTLTSRKQGAGLGLSIARGIIEDLGGTLSYREREGGGSIFIVTLPANGEIKK